MRSFLPNRRGAGAAVVLVAMLVAGVSMRIGVATRVVRPQSSPTPFELFQKMLPVIRHPRCANCHGGVDPYSGRGHGPGAIDTVSAHKGSYQCNDCHMAEWALPSRPHFFTGKTDRELCQIFAEFAMQQGHVRVIENHIRTDSLIIAGFAGDAGGPKTPVDPPSMKHAEFVDHAKNWLEQGQAACELLGTMKLEESVAASDSFEIGALRTHTTINGKRTVTITLRDGKYYADITTDYTLVEIGKQMMANPKTGQPCTITSTRNERQAGTTTGIASVAIKDTIFFFGTKPPQTDYRINVTLPAETTTKNELRTVQDECDTGLPFLPARETGSYTWGRAWFVIEGHLQDPKTDGRVGTCERDWKSTEINTLKFQETGQPCFRFKRMGNSWYLGLMRRTLPTTFNDNTPIPYHLRANWNLKYSK